MTVTRMTKVHDLPTLLAMSELIRLLEPVPASTIYKMVKNKKFESVIIGRRIMVKSASVRRFLNEEPPVPDSDSRVDSELKVIL